MWLKPPFPTFLLLCFLGSLMLHWAAAKLLGAHIGLLYTPTLKDVPGRKEHVMKFVINSVCLSLIQRQA